MKVSSSWSHLQDQGHSI